MGDTFKVLIRGSASDREGIAETDSPLNRARAFIETLKAIGHSIVEAYVQTPEDDTQYDINETSEAIVNFIADVSTTKKPPIVNPTQPLALGINFIEGINTKNLNLGLAAIGGMGNYTYSVQGDLGDQLPGGLSLDSSTGLISGTLLESTDKNVYLKVSDGDKEVVMVVTFHTVAA